MVEIEVDFEFANRPVEVVELGKLEEMLEEGTNEVDLVFKIVSVEKFWATDVEVGSCLAEAVVGNRESGCKIVSV